MRVAGFVLAGGKSSRMGQDKALLELNGETLVARGLRTLAMSCAEVAICGGGEELARFGRVVEDAYPDCGPLGGIVSALEQSELEWNMFLPVDVPFVPVGVLDALKLCAGGWHTVVVAEVAGRVQPLVGVYSRRALPVLQRELEAGRWKVATAIEVAGPVKRVPFQDAGWFRNLNTPEEFLEAEISARGLRPR